MGEHAARGVMTSMGDGVYKSEDSGVTWKHIGLDFPGTYLILKSTHLIQIYFLLLFKAHNTGQVKRGIYKTLDGGKTWEKVLYINNKVGASSLSMDMNNPRILYAAMWEHERTPWQMKSGGPVQEFINLQMGAKIGQN